VFNLFHRRSHPRGPFPDSPPHFLKNLVDSLTEGVLAVDSPDRRIVLANPAMTSSFESQPAAKPWGNPSGKSCATGNWENCWIAGFQQRAGGKKELAFGSESTAL
jgi:hypothetical protein